MKKQVILFGTGLYAKSAYYKLKEQYQIIYFVNNNIKERELYNIPIISIDQLIEVYEKNVMDIIICARDYYVIANQLAKIGVCEYYILLEGLLYRFDKIDVMMPTEIYQINYYKKKEDEKNILLVENIPSCRTHSIADMMKKKGYKVFLLYMILPMEVDDEKNIERYTDIYSVFTVSSLVDFINNSDFDIIYSSDKSNILINYLYLTNKNIAFDSQEMNRIREKSSIEELALLYMAKIKNQDKKINIEDFLTM